MIILDVKLDGIYGFDEFEINFSYPKKVVNSIIEDEHLAGRPRFRYKKAIVLMGTNASGKTTLGKALHHIFSWLQSGFRTDICSIATKERASFSVDFVNRDYVLHRFLGTITKSNEVISVNEYKAIIEKNDSYEKCVRKLQQADISESYMHTPYSDLKGQFDYLFSYPGNDELLKTNDISMKKLLKTMKAVIGTLDPTLTDVVISSELKNAFIIKRDSQEIIIQEGKLLNRDLLSSGTMEGIDVAVFLAAMMSNQSSFYYCDEHFSYIQSDIEKRIFGIMLDHLPENSQLVFTTHNTDMLDLNLPKHTYVFLRKRYEEGKYRITSISASDILKRNTDSVRNAVENDVFTTIPDDTLLDKLELGWSDE